MNWLFALGALVVVIGWLGHRRGLERGRTALTDADIQAIESGGRVRLDEPLDLEEAAEEEERFWSETWDEPEPM